MFTPQLVQIESIGEHVVLSIGNWRREIQYQDALLLAHWMVRRAREAKASVRDNRFGFRLLGTLHDAEKPDAGQPLTGRRIVGRDLLKLSKITVEQRGPEVVLRFGSDEVALSYVAATQIAQWIRLRGKESKRRAGDVARHWSNLVLASDPEVTRG